MDRLLLDVRKNIVDPAAGLLPARATVGIANPCPSPAAGRQALVDRVVVVGTQAELFQVINALTAPCRLPRRLHGRQQQCDQYANDGDHDQKFHQRERALHLVTLHVRFLKTNAPVGRLPIGPLYAIRTLKCVSLCRQSSA